MAEDASPTDAPPSTAGTPATKSQSNSEFWNRVWFEGLAIAAFTVAIYAAAYRIELGYADFFGIPVGLIQVSLGMCLNAGMYMLGIVIVFATAGLLMVLRHFDPSEANRDEWKWLAVLILGAMAFDSIRIRNDWPQYTIYCFFGLEFAVLCGLLWLGFRTPSDRTNFRTLESHVHSIVLKRLDRTAFRTFKIRFVSTLDHMGGGTFQCLGWLVVLYFLFFYFGQYAAISTREFLFDQKNRRVLLRAYGDLYVFKDFDPITNTIGTEVSVLDPTAVAELTFIQLKIRNATILTDRYTAEGTVGQKQPVTYPENYKHDGYEHLSNEVLHDYKNNN